ncbi:hypothetical protein POTOM_060275 [Populus tomentosa]|uniref:Glutathione S-transferase n=1 Tax=Populus tomentosa TaxID=118781 RepID=A0A8X7XNG3_POPTO|nr:hypothetical protein POTOM_060275 [Populus tomentosa]
MKEKGCRRDWEEDVQGRLASLGFLGEPILHEGENSFGCLNYESKEEDLFGRKRELLLKSNPIYQKVPVLLHNGKPLNESAIIVGYIDDKWPSPPLLPACAYGRSQACFWADYIDKKLFDATCTVWKSTGEAMGAAKKDFIEVLKVWFYASEKFGNFTVESECPKLSAWIKRSMQRKSVAKALPDPEKVYGFVVMFRKMQGIEKSNACIYAPSTLRNN